MVYTLVNLVFLDFFLCEETYYLELLQERKDDWVISGQEIEHLLRLK